MWDVGCLRERRNMLRSNDSPKSVQSTLTCTTSSVRLSCLISRVILTSVCAGIVDLSLACAQSWDPTDRAVSYWLEGTPPNDTRSVDYALRRNCNDLVFKGLNSADEVVRSAAQAAPGSKNVPIACESHHRADARRSLIREQTRKLSLCERTRTTRPCRFPTSSSIRSSTTDTSPSTRLTSSSPCVTLHPWKIND